MKQNNLKNFYNNYFKNSNYNSYRYDVGSYSTRNLIISNISKQSGNLLEIGTGISSMLQDLKHFNLYGIDFSENATSFTTKVLANLNIKATLTTGNAEKLPYPDNFFDVIISSHTLEHIKDDFSVIQECSRVLKTDGELIIFVPGRISGLATTKEFSSHGHYRYYNSKRFKELAKTTDSQLSLVKIRYPHKIHNFVWNRLKHIFRYVNYPIKKWILKDNKGYEERKNYKKRLLPAISFTLNQLDKLTEKKESNFFKTEFNVLAVFKKTS